MATFRRSLLASLAIVTLLFAVGCGDSDDTDSGGDGGTEAPPEGTGGEGGSGGGGGGNAVAIADFKYDPPELTVPVGTEVTFTNEDDAAHTATGDGEIEFDSGNLDNGGTFSHTFDQAGTAEYICTIHTSMNGTITVE